MGMGMHISKWTWSSCDDRSLFRGPQVKEEGWLPQHVLVRDADTKELLGAVPLYLKSHSYGGADR